MLGRIPSANLKIEYALLISVQRQAPIAQNLMLAECFLKILIIYNKKQKTMCLWPNRQGECLRSNIKKIEQLKIKMLRVEV